MKRFSALASFPCRSSSSSSALFLVSARRNYTNAVSSALVPPLPPFMEEFMPRPSVEEPAYDINPEDWANFNEEYQKLLKKFNAKEGTPEAVSLFEATKAKLVTLEDAKTNFPAEYNKFVEGYEALENDLLNYTPTIQATVDEAFDTKNHPFVTDPLGAYIFACASEYFDRKDFITKLQGQHLGLTPRRKAELLWAKAMARKPVPTVKPKEVAPQGDMPGWLVAFFDSFYAAYPELKTAVPPPKTKAEAAVAIFGSPEPYLPASSGYHELTGKELQNKRWQIMLKNEKLAPDSPSALCLQTSLSDLQDEVRPTGLTAFEEAMSPISARTEALLKTFETEFLSKPTNEVAVALNERKTKFSGEDGMVRSGVRGFLLGNPFPNTGEKVKFMQKMREAILKRRQASGIVLHQLYPSVPGLQTPKVWSDEELARKFDQIAADL